MSKRGFGVVIVFLVGCAVGGGASQLAVPQASAKEGRQKWDYYCFEDNRAAEVLPKAKAAGAKGWEMVAVLQDQPITESTWCFKRPM